MRLRNLGHEILNSLFLSVLTAVVTLLLAVLLSVVLGQENRQHREAQRCQAALIVMMLRDAYSVNPVYQPIADRYPRINLSGLDCRPYWSEPFEMGQ